MDDKMIRFQLLQFYHTIFRFFFLILITNNPKITFLELSDLRIRFYDKQHTYYIIIKRVNLCNMVKEAITFSDTLINGLSKT